MTHSPTHNNQDYNAFRVALASTDGYEVNTHFGRAETFYIYQFFIDEWIFIEKRAVKPACQNGKHSIEEMQKNAALFADCKYVVASKIGAGALSALQSQGIIPMNLPGDVNDALEKIFSYNEVQKLFQ